ncbi:Zinc finger BED domain-containing protein 5 [Araneus ventricosus]|uniref:Zinc finger BED domain-containing protein 5 n=1 Tax=Araneus ventricosus TaxID=182803 RepID=A0A4Y2M1I3_ARAVE|nr:Zinc finger BED domain-containing protein 5 [Araneus ventricosus]
MEKKFKTDNQKITEASYKVSYRIALAGEAHVIGELLIKPCVHDIVSCVLGGSYSKQVESVSLSNNNVKKRIIDIADDIELELISRLQACNAYALQLDESTDVSGLAILLVFVRYDFNKKIEEDLLLCESVNIDTMGETIFNCTDNFMTTHEINWGKCIEVCSDGAKAMTGKVSGVVARSQNVAKNYNGTHWILHRYALVTKGISATFKSVLDEAVKIISFIKSKPLQSCIFKAMCEDMGSLHTTLLFHTEFRWLSRGKMLVRIFELLKELMAYFIGHKFEL